MTFRIYMLSFAAQPLPLKGTIICIKYTLKMTKLISTLTGTIHYEKHTHKRDKKLQIENKKKTINCDLKKNSTPPPSSV